MKSEEKKEMENFFPQQLFLNCALKKKKKKDVSSFHIVSISHPLCF